MWIEPTPVSTSGDPLWNAVELALGIAVVLLVVDGGKWVVSKWIQREEIDNGP